MRKARDGEKMANKMGGKKNNGENSGPLTWLQVDRLTATDCNAAARAKKCNLHFPKCTDIIDGNYGGRLKCAYVLDNSPLHKYLILKI